MFTDYHRAKALARTERIFFNAKPMDRILKATERAFYRMFNLDRYDNRNVIATNLLESYDRLLKFVTLELATFAPFPKNPTISKIFRKISLADELSSGMRNTYRIKIFASQFLSSPLVIQT